MGRRWGTEVQQRSGDTAGGRDGRGNITLSQTPSWGWSTIVILPRLPTAFLTMQQRHVSVRRCRPPRAGDCAADVGPRGQGYDWKRRRRISGPAEGASGLPAVENQLVSRPASPAPSASHLLDPLGGLVNLVASCSAQRLCYSVLVVPSWSSPYINLQLVEKHKIFIDSSSERV